MKKLSRKGVVQMISIPSFVQKSQQTLRQWVLQRHLQRLLGPGVHSLAGFFLSAASAAARPLPLAMGFICGSSGWRALASALGSMIGYLLFWPRSGEIFLWLTAALAVSLLERWQVWQRAPLLIPALAALIVASSGVFFRSAGADLLTFGIYLLRVVLAAGSTWLFRQVIQRRGALTDWLGCGFFVFSLAQILPVPWLGLGYIAAAALSSGAPFPAAALGGMALDLAQVTPVPMTAVTALAQLTRFLPCKNRWLSRAAPAAVYISVMALTGKVDLLPLPGLVLGGVLSDWLPPPGNRLQRRGETGTIQVRLEMAAGVLNQARQILLEAPIISVDEEALINKAVQRACSSCPYRKSCSDTRRMGQLSGPLLRKPLLYAQELPITCRKSSRFLNELRRSQEQLYAIEADRRHQQEYRSATMQQYQFLSSFLQDLSDQLLQRSRPIRQFYTPHISVWGNRPEDENGDRCTHFSGTQGRYYVLLCDGMGTGPGAIQESRQASGMLKGLLQAGFPAEYALQSLNSLCALRDRAGAVTVDLAEIRLDSGKTVLHKWGSAPSCLVSQGGAERIGVTGPPPGIWLEERRETVHAITLRRDQILVLVSDGFSPDEVLRCCTEGVGQTADRLGMHLMDCLRSGRVDDATAVLVTLESIPATEKATFL